MTHIFRHPKHYKEMRAKRRKLQAPSVKPQAEGSRPERPKLQAASDNMKNFNIVSGKDINKALEKMNNWHFRYDSNTYTTFNKVENALRKNWLWKTKEINKFKKILFKHQAPSLKHQANQTLSCKPQAPSTKLQAPSPGRRVP